MEQASKLVIENNGKYLSVRQVSPPSLIYETEISNVTKVCRVVARTGTKQVGSVTSNERAEIDTFSVFPQKNFKNYFTKCTLVVYL